MSVETPSSDIHSKPKNRWTTRQREVLCVLHKFYQNPLSESVHIFNTLFEKDLRKCGFTDGICHPSLTSQWYELFVSGSFVFERVHIETLLSDESERWTELREEIEEAAERLGITLNKRKFEHFRDISKFGSRPHKRHEATTENDTHAPSPSKLDPITPRRRSSPPQQQEQQSSRSSRSSRSSNQFSSSASGRRQRRPVQVEIPALLYRYWSASSNGFNSTDHFVAGLFRDHNRSIPSIVSYSQDKIDMMTFNHLNREETPSPFISTSGTLFSPLHRALRQEAHTSAAISIIDISKLDSTTIFSAQKIISDGGLDFSSNYSYRGTNEWLIWGEIPTESIICYFTMHKLLDITKNFPEIKSVLHLDTLQKAKQAGHTRKCLRDSLAKVDEPTGMIIGKFLRLIDLSAQYLEQVSLNILVAWNIEGVFWHGHDLDPEKYENYLGGVRKGYDFSIDGQPVVLEPKKEVDENDIILISDTDDEEMSMMTPDSSPLSRVSEKGVELRVFVPAGQGLRPSTLAGLKQEMDEDDIGKDSSTNPIQWEILDMQQSMEWNAVDAEKSREPVKRGGDENDDERIYGVKDHFEEGVYGNNVYHDGVYGDENHHHEGVDRFTAERNRINRLLNL